MLPFVTRAIVVIFFCSAVVWDNELWPGKCSDQFGPGEGDRLGGAASFAMRNAAELCVLFEGGQCV